MDLFKKAKRIDDVIYGYAYNNMSELVIFIKKVMIAEKRYLKFIPVRKEVTESLKALPLPTELNFYLVDFSKNNPIETDEEGEYIYNLADISALKTKVNKQVLEMYEKQFGDNEEALDKIKKDREDSLVYDSMPLATNLNRQGWVNVWNIKKYTVRKSYWLRSDKYNNVQIGIIRYTKNKEANNKFDILEFSTYALPGDIMDCIFKKEQGGK